MENISSCIKNEFDDIDLDFSGSYTTAIKSIYENKYDLILLDMSLPFTEDGEENFEDNEFETFGGINILDELKRIYYKTKVILITAFDILGDGNDMIKLSQLNETLNKNYCEIYKGYIHYNSSSIEWKNLLKLLIEE